jgi:peptidoglycan-N-acetylglucosamine deacetylase
LSRTVSVIAVVAFVLCMPVVGGTSGVLSSAIKPSPSRRHSRIESSTRTYTSDIAHPIPLRSTTRALVAAWTGQIGRVRRSGPAPVLNPEREILLTFDDGPDMVTTPFVLAELQRRGLKAIFFVAGRRLIAPGERGRIQRALVQEMVNRGHLVANHTIWHKHLCDRPEIIAAEIDGNDEIIRNLTGQTPLLFRAPFGDKCPELDIALRGRGLVDVGWNIDPQDWQHSRKTDDIIDYVRGKLARLPHRAVLLLHDTRKAGVRALPAILDHIAEENRRALMGLARPIVIRNYAVLLPEKPLPKTGIGEMVVDVSERLQPVAELLWPKSASERKSIAGLTVP